MDALEASGMDNFFMAGSDLIRWNLEVLPTNGSCPLRLTVRHAQGAIVEYFPSTEAALTRERELEGLLMAARGAGRSIALDIPIEVAHR